MEYKGYCMMKCALDCIIGYSELIDPVGYHQIEANLNEGNHIYPIIDIATDVNGLLLINQYGPPCLVQVNSMESVSYWFECDHYGQVLIPIGLNPIQRMLEANKRLMRDGGYGPIVRRMVIMNSLVKGKFSDDFLFEVQ